MKLHEVTGRVMAGNPAVPVVDSVILQSIVATLPKWRRCSPLMLIGLCSGWFRGYFPVNFMPHVYV